MKPRSSQVLFLLALLSAQGYSQEAGNGDAGNVADAEARFLFINMLEFLGEFETQDGDWIPPDILDNDAFVDLDGAGTVVATPAGETGGGRDRSADRDDD